jgi:hypothetical protein
MKVNLVENKPLDQRVQRVKRSFWLISVLTNFNTTRTANKDARSAVSQHLVEISVSLQVLYRKAMKDRTGRDREYAHACERSKIVVMDDSESDSAVLWNQH